MLSTTQPVQNASRRVEQRRDPFPFPPWYHYPPLYTIQPCTRTRERQLHLWRRLILDYCEYYCIFTLRLNDAESSQMPLFCNRAIQRRLSRESLLCIFQDLVLRGDAAWSDPDTKEEMLVFWRSPRNWADELLQIVAQFGQNRGGVFTLQELGSLMIEHSSICREMGSDTDRAVMPVPFLQYVLSILTAEGKARVFGTSEGHGVKFAYT
ncbi:hypothetical protein CCYA_CCYA09G2648 [Cyanidiococcus yangmingshanensis]|nr:hypothetical protein CCYA_CCYA09G2648 [Cyanidiococcus yangmingshanensis]